MFFKSYISHLIAILFMVISLSSFSQEYSEKNIIDVANSIINDSNSCVFITLDSNNNPTSRLMDPYIYNNDFEIYLVTNPNSRKVSHIRDDNRITLNFTSKDGESYVSINGTAKLINDLNLKKKFWKSTWTPYYNNLDKDCILIKITPKSLELVSSSNNITSDPYTWKPASIIFQP